MHTHTFIRQAICNSNPSPVSKPQAQCNVTVHANCVRVLVPESSAPLIKVPAVSKTGSQQNLHPQAPKLVFGLAFRRIEPGRMCTTIAAIAAPPKLGIGFGDDRLFGRRENRE